VVKQFEVFSVINIKCLNDAEKCNKNTGSFILESHCHNNKLSLTGFLSAKVQN